VRVSFFEQLSIGSQLTPALAACGRCKTAIPKFLTKEANFLIETKAGLYSAAYSMNLFILRHGIAVEPADENFENDADRPLTQEGRTKLKAATAAMLKLGLNFDVVLSSPYKRARQTAEIVGERLKVEITVSEFLEPNGSIPELVTEINALKPKPANILLVGHEPHLSALLSVLVSGESRQMILLKKGALAKLEATTLKAGRCALLKWLLTPKQLQLIGDAG
jgi:phosphohistidine phosphatase